MTIYEQNMQKLFFKACEKGLTKLAAKYIEHGANPTADDNCAIRLASHNGHAAVVKLLLEHGADPTSGNNYAIRLASYYGHAAVVEILKKHLTEQKLQSNIG